MRTLQNTSVPATAPPPEEGDMSAPERIAGNAAAFLDAHLRMKDVRQYLLDLLKTYSALQTFQVRDADWVVCRLEFMLEISQGSTGVPTILGACAPGMFDGTAFKLAVV